MPTYEFRCPQGHEFDRFYKTMSTAPAEVPCSECGAVAARQLSGGGGLVFKGSGFYLTDYGKNAHRGAAPERKGEGTKVESAKGEGAKSETSKADSAKGESTKSEGTASKSDAKSESPKPKASSPKPQADE